MEKYSIPKNASVFDILIQRKQNGWFLTATFDGSMSYTRQFVFNNKKQMFKFMEKIIWYPNSGYEKIGILSKT